MIEWPIAIYFGVGVFIVQFLHTLHSANTYGQKQVRALEGPLFRTFDERSDPHSCQVNVFRPFKRPFHWPWNLPDHQMDDPPKWYKWFGLQATNLYYGYAVSIVYGGLTILLVRYFPFSGGNITLPFIGLYLIFVTLLLWSSFYFIGSGLEISALEANLAFNSLILLGLAREAIELQSAVGMLQIMIALVAATIGFWLTLQYETGNLDFSNFMPAYFLAASLGYSEFGILALTLFY